MNILKNQVYINPMFLSERVTEHGENSHTLTSAQATLSFTSWAMDVFLDMMVTLVTINEKEKCGNGNPLRYSCLENPMDGGAWWAAVHRVTKSWTQLSDFTFTFHFHACQVASVMSDSVWPYGQQPTRFLWPHDSLGKNVGVGCHFHLGPLYWEFFKIMNGY